MGILTFKGGVHPYDGKELSKNSPVVKYLPKGDMVYPLSQHIGAPAAAIVQKGDHVLAGQKIADAAGFVSSPIHSSVSGTVKGIEPRLTATGSMVNSIIIENDQQYESVEFTPARLEDLSKEEILARIKEGGVDLSVCDSLDQETLTTLWVLGHQLCYFNTWNIFYHFFQFRNTVRLVILNTDVSLRIVKKLQHNS